MNYYFTTYQISNKNTRLYTRFIVENIVQMIDLHYVFYCSTILYNFTFILSFTTSLRIYFLLLLRVKSS